MDCSYNGRYIDESNEKVLTHCIEDQQDSIKGNWESSSVIEHTKEFHGQFNWIHSRTIAIMPNMYKKTVCEALEINRLKTSKETDKMFKLLSRDFDDNVITNSWESPIQKIGNH